MELVRTMVRRVIKPAAILILCGCLSACAYFGMGTEKPEVYLTSFRPLPSSGLEARFVVGLKVINITGRDLNISGMSYRLKLNGYSVASGSAGAIGNIPAHGEKRIEVEASTHLFASLRMLADILQNPPQAYDYELQTQLRMPWSPVPITVVESGEVMLGK